MPLSTLQLSLQIGALADAGPHRAALPRHKVTRWIRHALTARILDVYDARGHTATSRKLAE